MENYSEYIEKKKKEKLANVRERIDALQKEYKQTGTIKFVAHNRDNMSKTAMIILLIIVFLLFLIPVGIIMHILSVEADEETIKQFKYAIGGIGGFFGLGALCEIIFGTSTKYVDTILFHNEVITINLLDKHMKTDAENSETYPYYLKDIVLTTRLNYKWFRRS